jgi:putative transposase
MFSGRTFFITTNTWQRRPIFRDETRASLLVEVLLHYRVESKYLLHEFVVMPDHLHALLTPARDVSLEHAVQFIKGGFSFRLKSRMPVWQPSFTNHRVRDLEDFESHRQYIWFNPVRAKLAACPGDYPYTSARGDFVRDAIPGEEGTGAKAQSLETLTRA